MSVRLLYLLRPSHDFMKLEHFTQPKLSKKAFEVCYLGRVWENEEGRSVILFSDPGGLGAHSADSSLRKDHGGEEAKTLREGKTFLTALLQPLALAFHASLWTPSHAHMRFS